ncbi:hypothetical protein EBT16_12640 [bacterium]|nr:hypothetical protein [bacterium]
MSNQSQELVLIPGNEKESEKDFLDYVRGSFHPNLVVVLKTEKNASLPLVQSRNAKEGLATAYLCEQQSCRSPITALADLEEALDG